MVTQLPQVTVTAPDAVSLGVPPSADDDAVSLPTPNTLTIPPSIDVAKQRTAKTQMGLSDVLGKTTEDTYQTFLDGKENLLRTQAATTLDYQKAMNRQKQITDLASKQGPLRPEQIMQIMDPFSPANAPADPATVIEKAYASNYISAANTAAGFMSDTNPLNVARREIPEQTDKTMDDAGDIFTKNQYIQTRMQNTQQNIVGNQSWTGYLADQAKGLFQPYVEYKERGNVDDINFAGIGLGANKEEQSNTLYRKKFKDFKETFDKSMDYLEKDNPSLAVAWAQSMLGASSYEQTLDNVFTAMAVPDAAAGVKGVAGLAKKVVAYNQIRKAAKDIVIAGTRDPNATPANIAGGAGDVVGAAVKNVSTDVSDAIQGVGDPLKVASNTLMSTWKDDAEKYISNPGTYLSREAYTRIHDGFAKDGEDLLGRIETMNRVERQPLAVTSENVINAYKDKIRSDFKGPPGMLLDVEGPIREEASGSYWYKLHLGDYDGAQFSDVDTALGRAEQIGLAKPIIEGEASNRVYLPGAAVKHLESVETKNGVTKFYVDHGVEVVASPKPEPGHVPVTIETSGEKTFTTSKGSKYVVHDDGTTTRDKALRPEHPGDQGSKPRSTETFYITEQEYQAYKNSKNRGDKSFPDGRGTTLYTDIANDVSILPKKTPEKGLVPVEVWNDGKSRQIHFGNQITEVKEPKTNVKFHPILDKESTRVEQQGMGFRLVHWLPMKETDDVLRDLMIRTTGGDLVPEATSTASSTGINSIKNSLLGWVRNSDDTLSINEAAQRKAATYTQSNIQKWAKQLNQDLEDIKNGIVRNDPVTGEPISAYVSYPKSFLGKVIPGKKVFQDFERALDASRRLPDPVTGENGYFFKTGAELQDFYNRSFNRDPSFLETKAYFNYVKIKEGERMIGEITEFRNRARVGAEQHQITIHDLDTGKDIKSGFFDGVDKKDVFPGGDDFMLVMGDAKGGEELKKLGNINTKQLTEMKRQWKTGEARVIEVFDVDHQPLSSFVPAAYDKRIRYVFSRNAETKPLEFNHVDRRGGAHFEWDYDHYVKQANMKPQAISANKFEHIYVNDTTVMPIKNKRLGENVARLWNQAHDFINAGDWNSAKPIAARLGIDWKEFTGWYHPGRDALGNATPPRLNPKEPMRVVTRNKTIRDIDSSLQERYPNSFKDGTKTGLANNFKVAYNTERRSYDGLKTINDVGSKDNPIYAHQPASFVDPITTMNRSLNRAINSIFMDDYKLYGVEHWLREAEPYLNVTKSEVRASPFWHFNNPEFRRDMPLDVKMNLMSNRYKIQTFIGVPSKFDAWVHNFTQHLSDTAYARSGPQADVNFKNAIVHPIDIAPVWVLHNLKNPVDFIRSATFNYKLGFLNPAQFLVQAQTHSLIWALEPKHGTVGTYAMMLHGWSRVNKNPAILESLDKYYTKMNMFGSKPRLGEFSEAMRELDKSGFEHVAGEYANLSKAYLPTTNFVQNDIQKGLRLGQTPFRLGEQSTRVTAWYTAFREFRETNPTTPITNIERSKILNKADLLTVNMSRASSSMINHGVFSLSSQFLSYQIKLAELFWSKRIGETATDRALARARLIGGFALLYGMPNAMGVTGAPISDNIRQHLREDLGYLPGENWLSTMVNEGFPAWSYAMITGRGDLQAGLVPNVGDRFGSQGWQNIKQAMRSDIPWWQGIGGAGVSTASNFISAALDPFYQGALSWARGDTKDQRFTLRGADLIEPWKEISTVSAGTKWWSAIKTGQWFSKNESYVTDVSPFNATVLALTGMNPQEQDDMFTTNQMVKGEIDAQKVALKEFIKDWRRGIQSKQNGDEEQGNAYHRNAMARLTTVGYPYEKILSAIAIANKGYESAIDSSDYKSWTTGDRNKQEDRMQMYKRQLQLKDKRAQ